MKFMKLKKWGEKAYFENCWAYSNLPWDIKSAFQSIKSFQSYLQPGYNLYVMSLLWK